MMMSSGLNHGLRASIPHLLGICFGVPTMILGVGLGLGYVFERFPYVHQVIQVIGIVYLIYLAWLIANAAPGKMSAERTKPLSFMQAALFQWVNPKAWIMGTSAIAAYTTVGSDINLQIVIIAGFFFLVTFPSVAVWLVFGAALKKVLSDPRHLRLFNISMALLLIASVIPIVSDLIQKYL